MISKVFPEMRRFHTTLTALQEALYNLTFVLL